jgi:RND family efflux transporter MFP subunit
MRPGPLVAAVAAIAVAGLLVWRMTAATQSPADAEAAPTAVVTVSPVRMGNVDEVVTAYGVATGAPGSARAVAVARAVIVERVLAPNGSAVRAGQPLLVVADAPVAAQAYRQAADAVRFAERDLERIRRLAAAGLAANDQLNAGEKTLADAQAALAAQTAAGAGHGRQILLAPVAGVVSALSVSAGDHVATDAPLAAITGSADLAAQLAVEPGKAGRLAPGQVVTLTSVFDPGRLLQSRLALVSRQVDATSHMVMAVAPLPGAPLAIGESLRARIVTATHQGLLAPRAAVVNDEDGDHVFVVRDGKARRIPVALGAASCWPSPEPISFRTAWRRGPHPDEPRGHHWRSSPLPSGPAEPRGRRRCGGGGRAASGPVSNGVFPAYRRLC